jgi:hypothetical protein
MLLVGLPLIAAPPFVKRAIYGLATWARSSHLASPAPRALQSGGDWTDVMELLFGALMALGLFLVAAACVPRVAVAWVGQLWRERHPLVGFPLALIAPFVLVGALAFVMDRPPLLVTVVAAATIFAIVRTINRRQPPGPPADGA